MKKSLVSLLTCGILVLGIAFQSAAQNQKDKEKAITTWQIKLEVEGMACSMCEQGCKKSLEKLNGVKVESISASKGIAQISFTGTEPISDEKLKEAVEKAGFKLEEVHRGETNNVSNSGPDP